LYNLLEVYKTHLHLFFELYSSKNKEWIKRLGGPKSLESLF